jgi:hypothetical protein
MTPKAGVGWRDPGRPGVISSSKRQPLSQCSNAEAQSALSETADRYSPYRDVFARANELRPELRIVEPGA